MIRVLSFVCLLTIGIPLFVNETMGAAQSDFLKVTTIAVAESNHVIISLTALEDVSTFLIEREEFEFIGLDVDRNEVLWEEIEIEERQLNLSVIRWYPGYLVQHFNERVYYLETRRLEALQVLDATYLEEARRINQTSQLYDTNQVNPVGHVNQASRVYLPNQVNNETIVASTITPTAVVHNFYDYRYSDAASFSYDAAAAHASAYIPVSYKTGVTDPYHELTYVPHPLESCESISYIPQVHTQEGQYTGADISLDQDQYNCYSNIVLCSEDECIVEDRCSDDERYGEYLSYDNELYCEDEQYEYRIKAARFFHRDSMESLIFLHLQAGDSIELLLRILCADIDFEVYAYRNADIGSVEGQKLLVVEGTNSEFGAAVGIIPAMQRNVNQITRTSRPINTAEIRITRPTSSPINTPATACIGYTTIGGTQNRNFNQGIIVTSTATVGQAITLSAVAPNAGVDATFQWYLGDARIPGATSLTGNTFTPQTRGNHVFQVVMSNNNQVYASNRVEVRVGGGPAIREFQPIHNPVDETGITVNLFSYGHGVNRFTNASGLGFHHVTHWNPNLGMWGDREYWRIQTVNAGVHYRPWRGDQNLRPVNNHITGYYIRRPYGNAVMSPTNVVGRYIWFSYSRINNNVGQFHDRPYVVHRRQNELVFRNLGADGFPVTRRYVRPADQHYGRWTQQTFQGRSLNYLFDPNYRGINEATNTQYNNRFPHNNPNIPGIPGVSTPWVSAKRWNTDNGSLAPHFVPTAVRSNYDRRTYRPQAGNSGLFQRDADGFFYYDSVRNHAYFNRATNRFELYDYIMFPYMVYIHNPTTGQPTCRRPGNVQSHFGNFMPFNRPAVNHLGHLNPANRVIRQNVAGRRVISTAPALWENWTRDRASIADLWLGMHIEVDFYMPHNGQVQDRNGELMDMIFEFSGDDDVWVFINGVLVLDIGGCSNADHGLINFRTGQVTTNRNPRETNSVNTTLREQFRVASPGVMPPAFGYALYDPLLADYHWRTPYQTGPFAGPAANIPARRPFHAAEFGGGNNPNTFAPGTTHTLSFFFMERHAGMSHCYIRFNLTTIPDIAIGKEVDPSAYDLINPAIAHDVVIHTDFSFDFQLEAGTSQNNLSRRANEQFHVYSLDSFGQLDRVWIRSAVTRADGTFTLLDGEVAVFPNIPSNMIFRVRELPISTEHFSNITVNAPYTVTRGADGSYLTAITDPLERGIHPKVSVTNQLRGREINDLEVVKRVLEGYERDEEDVFRFQVVFGEDEVPYSGYYYFYRCDGVGGFVAHEPHRRRVNNTHGMIDLHVDEKFVIRGILDGTFYRVEEIDILDVQSVSVMDEYHTPAYAVSTTRDAGGNILWCQEWYGWYVEGQMTVHRQLQTQNPIRIQFTNRTLEEDPLGQIKVFKYSTALFEKEQYVRYGVRTALSGAEFILVTREDYDRAYLNNPIDRGVSNEYGMIYFRYLPLGEYVLIETRAPEGYELLRAPIFIHISEDDLYVRIDVANHPQSFLPFAGGDGVMSLLLKSMAVFILGFGIVGIYHMKQQKQKEVHSLIRLLEEAR